jgi:uncharacterized protein (DUF433 family)
MSGRYPLNLPVDLKQEAEQVAKQQGISLNQLILWSLAEKVTALKSKLDDPQYPNITYKIDTQGNPVPILRGSGLRVQTIVIWANVWNEPAAKVAQEYDLPVRLVKEALSFYDAHKKVVDALIELNDEVEKNHV